MVMQSFKCYEEKEGKGGQGCEGLGRVLSLRMKELMTGSVPGWNEQCLLNT